MSANKFCKVIDKDFLKLVQLYNSSVDMGYKTEFFKKLLDKEFNINYKIPSNYIFGKEKLVGCTIFQLLSSKPYLCQILIGHGADYTITDTQGSTNLLRETIVEYEQHLCDVKLRALEPKPWTNGTLDAHISSENSKNPKDKNGLSHFHVACMYNHADAAKFFLEAGVSVNETVNRDSTFYPGYSALHFAVKSWAFETVELLLKLGADVFAKDSKGMNPLHVLIADRREIFCRLKRIPRIVLIDEEKNEFFNFFDSYSKSERIIHLLLNKMNEFGCYLDNDTGLSYFHILCFLGNMSIIQQFLDDDKKYLIQSVSIDSPICSGYTPLHFAAHSNVETIELLVKRGADLNVKDAKGVTPFDICLREFSIADIHRIFSQQPHYSNIVFSDGRTKLCDFIHAMQDTATFENFLKDNLEDLNVFIPFDSPLCAGYTPLHLAIICTEQPMTWSSENCVSSYGWAIRSHHDKSETYLAKIDSCLRYNSDVTCRDAQGSTPLHWAFRLQQTKAILKLLGHDASSSNPVDKDGFSHLHIACAAGQEDVVQKLLSEGANVNEVAISSYIWKEIDTSSDYDIDIREYCVNEGSTPLHFAASAKCPKVVEILIGYGADVLAKDAHGLNPLDKHFKRSIFRESECSKFRSRRDFRNKITELLVRKIGDRLADTNPNQMLHCYSLLEEELFIEILSHEDESVTKILANVGITALHVACFTQNFERVNELIHKVDVNASVNLESPLWPGCTPLHLFSRDKPENVLWADLIKADKAILNTLLKNGADVAALNAKGETPIHRMFPFYEYLECVKKLIEYLKDFSVNPASTRGYTHLHIASACGDVSAVEKLLDHGAAIDQPTDYFQESPHIKHFAGYTALHLAALYQQKDVVEVLMKRGADVNRKNAYGETPLHAAVQERNQIDNAVHPLSVYHAVRRNFELLQTLVGAGSDIHARDMYGRTPLEILIKSENCKKEEVELFLANGSRVNTVNPISDEGLLAIAIKQSRYLPIFEMFLKVLDIKDIDDNGRNAIHNAVSLIRPDWSELGPWTSCETYLEPCDYIRGIDTLIKLGLDIDHQDCKGSTPLHVAAQMQNQTGIFTLLKNGADINIVDADGKLAFAYSLESVEFREENEVHQFRILKIILMHIYKLNMARIGISRSNKEVYAKICKQFSLDRSAVEECNNEVERMRKEEINLSSVTFYEFLSDTGAISVFPYMLPCNRIAIGSYFKDEIKTLREKFPLFAGILLLQYRKALVRGDLINKATTSFNTLVGFDMDDVCLRIIFRFLSNDALNNLIKSTKNK